MRIIYPYNEILPKQKAHDIFIFDECAALAEYGMHVTLLCGKGSADNVDLFKHYHVPNNAFIIERLPIIRKNNPFNLSWNAPFFFFSQRLIRRLKPDWVFLSVRKQGAYHLARKIPHVRYLYEIHELAYYPHTHVHSADFHVEQKMLNRADLITVTTQALKDILLAPPYSFTAPIQVVPLAVKKHPLPPPPENASPLVLMYIGQLYEGQGIERAIAALAQVNNITLKVVGGKKDEIARLKNQAAELGIKDAVDCLGFIPPASLAEVAKEAHAFIAPFDPRGKMPYVAHTKLFEYAQWGRPIIAPHMPIVKEHFAEGKGVLLYEPENTAALANCIRLMKEKKVRHRLQDEIKVHENKYSWQARAKQYHEILYHFREITS